MVLTKTLRWPSVALRLYNRAAVTESHQSVVTVQKKSVRTLPIDNNDNNTLGG